jgi:hypothetical protein
MRDVFLAIAIGFVVGFVLPGCGAGARSDLPVRAPAPPQPLAQARATWVPGYWRKVDRGMVWIEGHWS